MRMGLTALLTEIHRRASTRKWINHHVERLGVLCQEIIKYRHHRTAEMGGSPALLLNGY